MKVKYLAIVIAAMQLVACQTIMDMEQTQKPPIILKCSKQCATISLHSMAKVDRFLYSLPRSQTVKVSNCLHKQDPHLTKIVIAHIQNKGYRVAIVRQTLPYHHTQQSCVNLIKGNVSVQLPDCYPNIKGHRSRLVGHKFGCATQYNLIKMLRNPNDLLILSGVNGNLY